MTFLRFTKLVDKSGTDFFGCVCISSSYHDFRLDFVIQLVSISTETIETDGQHSSKDEA